MTEFRWAIVMVPDNLAVCSEKDCYQYRPDWQLVQRIGNRWFEHPVYACHVHVDYEFVQ